MHGRLVLARIVTRGSPVHVRAGPAERYPVVGYRNNGDTVAIAERSGEWLRIGEGQWVHGDYVQDAGIRPDPDQAGAVIDHPERPDDPHWRVLIGFASNSAELRRSHREWLGSYVCSQLRSGQYVYIRGMTSRLGSERHNRALSEARAAAVRDYLLSECGVSRNRITGVDGLGELRGRGSETQDDARSRAVEVIVTGRTVQLGGSTITGRRPISSTFYIKYVGGSSASLIVADGDLAFFVIRSDQDYWQRYHYEGGGAGISAPVSWGEGSPRGQGWVRFTTETPMTVSDFTGTASVGQVGAQVHSIGGSLIQLDADGIGSVTLPTGPGLSIGGSRTVGVLSTAGDAEFGNGWERF